MAEDVLSWLGGLGYLDDVAYARDRARSLIAPGRLGPRLAERRLLAAGIPPAGAREAVSAALRAACEGARGDEGAEAQLCRALAERRLRGSPLGSLDEKARARLARFLLQRGFSGRAVAQAIGVYLDQGD